MQGTRTHIDRTHRADGELVAPRDPVGRRGAIAAFLLFAVFFALGWAMTGCCVSRAELEVQLKARESFLAAVEPIVLKSAEALKDEDARASRVSMVTTERQSIAISRKALAR